MRRWVAVLAVVWVSVPSPVGGQGTVAIRDVTVISMVPEAPAARGTVIVREGKIAEVGPTDRVRVPAARKNSSGP